MQSLLQKLIGFGIRVYRSSPFFPHGRKFFASILAKISPAGNRVQKTIDGLTYDLDLSEVIDTSLYYYGTFEKEIERLIDDYTQPGQTVLDIGANVGYHTVRLARNVGPQGRVVAIEPTSAACVRLRRNLELNRCTNVDVQALALSDREEGVREVAFQSNFPVDGEPLIVPEMLRLTSLDVLLPELGVSDLGFIKLDVDGYEEKVLLGALATLRRDRPVLVLEVMPPAAGGPSRPLGLLQELGYSFYTEDRQPVPATGHAWQGPLPVNFLALPPGRAPVEAGRG
ncbi:MAG: FkbM family methyltransferase [Verrucomicrobia bacterium]|nr:FkbM family methyltransferase [Verrucomicrobiota bacterium]